jgi:uncharacterized protein (DUF1697 family)
VLFSHDERPSEGLSDKIAHIVRERFGIDTFAAVRSKEELRSAIRGQSFSRKTASTVTSTRSFSPSRSTGRRSRPFASAYGGPERLAPGTREFYVDFVEGAGNSKLGAAMSKAKVVKGRATARNLRSLRRMLEKMG